MEDSLLSVTRQRTGRFNALEASTLNSRRCRHLSRRLEVPDPFPQATISGNRGPVTGIQSGVVTEATISTALAESLPARTSKGDARAIPVCVDSSRL